MDLTAPPVPAPPAQAPPATRDIVAIGASAGGVPALQRLVEGLPRDLPASVFIVVHIAAAAQPNLARILDRAGPLPAVTAVDRMPIMPGRIVVAPPDRHLLLEHGFVRVVAGPHENRHRPAIDPLFRSAAWAYGPRVTGVVLTGNLDDGAAGLWAIGSCGGATVVQDPDDAAFPGMPQAALDLMAVDHCVVLESLPALLARLAGETLPQAAGKPPAPPPALRHEIDSALLVPGPRMQALAQTGALSPFTCPACGGALWELQDNGRLRYRCHTGHAFSAASLLDEQDEAVEEALYTALRSLEEKAAVLRRLGQRTTAGAPAGDYLQRAAEMESSADVLRTLLARAAAGPERAGLQTSQR